MEASKAEMDASKAGMDASDAEMDVSDAEIEPMAARVVAVVQREQAACLHLDDGRSLRISSMPAAGVFDRLCDACRAGRRIDYIEVCNMVTGRCRVLAWWDGEHLSVLALPSGQPTEIHCDAEARLVGPNEQLP